MRYDIGIIGGGPGGYVAAIKAAQMGASVVLFEQDQLGGTCLNRGCIPTKALLKSAQVYRQVQQAASFGIQVSGPVVAMADVIKRKDTVVRQLVSGVGSLLRKNGVQVVKASAELLSPGNIAADGKTYACRDVILAMGSKPSQPPIPGMEYAKNSDDVLSMTTLPKDVIIVGGGVIGIEFASLLSTLGARVTVVEMLPSVLAMADNMVIAEAEKLLKKLGVQIRCSAAVQKILPNGIVIRGVEGEETLKADVVVVATGRVPNVDLAKLDHLGIVHDRGRICTNAQMRTNLPHVYAIGDLNGKSMLAHTASREGIVAVRNALGVPTRMTYDRVPSCVYTMPEIAWIGRTERELKEQGVAYQIGTFPMIANGKSLIEGESDGAVKLLSDAATGEILGAHLVCAHATDMIMEIGMAMGLEAVAEDLAEAVHPHPTISESVMEAAESLTGKSIHF